MMNGLGGLLPFTFHHRESVGSTRMGPSRSIMKGKRKFESQTPVLVSILVFFPIASGPATAVAIWSLLCVSHRVLPGDPILLFLILSHSVCDYYSAE